MKTLSLDTSKRLKEYLKDVETEYVYSKEWIKKENIFENEEHLKINNFIKTLTLDEVIINILPSWIHLLKHIDNKWKPFYTSSSNRIEFVEETPLQAIEKMIIYLLDNNLLKND